MHRLPEPLIAAAAQKAGELPAWLPVAALFAGAVALFGMLISRNNERRDRRRTLYADAYKAALAWAEMFYRIRRRDPAKVHVLADQFHTLQEDLDFHQAWLASESRAFGRAYCRLIMTVKGLSRQPIQDAWKTPESKPENGFSLDGEPHPPVQGAKAQFTQDLRDHMSLNPLRRWRLRWRYRNTSWTQIKASLPGATTTPGGTP